MKSNVKTLLVALILLLAGVGAVRAQTGNGEMLMARLDRELQTTDQLLDRAQEAVRTYSTPLAEVNLKQAFELQNQAREMQKQLMQRFQLQLLGTATNTTVKARELARAAMTASRQTEQSEATVQRDLERAEQNLDRAREAAAGSSNKNLQALLNSAETNLARAWEFFRQEQYRPAYKIARQVENACQKIMAGAGMESRTEENYQRRLELVQQLMEQSRAQVAECTSGSESAQKFMEQAQASMRRAEELDSNHQRVAALKQLRIARELAIKAAEECQGTGSLQQRYELMLRQTERLTEMLQGQMGAEAETARKMVRQASEQLEMARKHIASQESEKAMAALKAAQLAIRQATKYTQGQTE